MIYKKIQYVFCLLLYMSIYIIQLLIIRISKFCSNLILKLSGLRSSQLPLKNTDYSQYTFWDRENSNFGLGNKPFHHWCAT